MLDRPGYLVYHLGKISISKRCFVLLNASSLFERGAKQYFFWGGGVESIFTQFTLLVSLAIKLDWPLGFGAVVLAREFVVTFCLLHVRLDFRLESLF